MRVKFSFSSLIKQNERYSVNMFYFFINLTAEDMNVKDEQVSVYDK